MEGDYFQYTSCDLCLTNKRQLFTFSKETQTNEVVKYIFTLTAGLSGAQCIVTEVGWSIVMCQDYL